ncbi:MAG: hypothetical protein JNK82_38940 [Myxococcaceae bacterium]|nr:hypothetical protein [Myxococcaceae bacterium]
MRRALAFVVVLGATVAGCKCGKDAVTRASGVERVLPAGGNAYVIVPSVEKLGQRLTLVENLKVATFAVQAANFETAKGYVDAMVAELGIDPRSREQLEQIGIDPSGSAGVAIMDGEGSLMVALPIKHEGRIAAFIRTLSANRLGASMVEDKVQNGVTVHHLVGAVGTRLAWASSNGYALIAPMASVEQLGGWASRAEADTLARDTSLPASLARLPAERDALVYVPPATKATLVAPVSHVVIALSLQPDAFTLTADAPWSGSKEALSLFTAQPAAPLVGLLPADAFFVARFGGDAKELAPLLLPLLGENLERAFGEGGFDLTAALEQVAPGAVLGLSLAPTVQMGQGMPDLDPRRTNPFSFVHLTGVAPAKSEAAVAPALEKLAAVAPRFGAQMTLKDGVYVTTYAQGEGVHFAAKGGQVVFGSPLPRVKAMAQGDDAGGGPVQAYRDVLEATPLAVVADLKALSDAVRALPSSAWGIGGFAIKATTVRWLDNSDDLKAVTVNVGTKGGAVQAKVQLKLAPQAPSGADAGR